MAGTKARSPNHTRCTPTRPAGTTAGRSRAAGAKTPVYRIWCCRGGGTSQARRRIKARGCRSIRTLPRARRVSKREPHALVVDELELGLGERRSHHVTAQARPPCLVLGGDAHRGVHLEAEISLALDGGEQARRLVSRSAPPAVVGPGLRRLVLLDKAVPLQPPREALLHAGLDLPKIDRCRCRVVHEVERAILVLDVSAVQDEDVKVWIDRERLIEPLKDDHRSARKLRSRAFPDPREDGLHEDARQRRKRFASRREQGDQLGGWRQHVLSHWHSRQHPRHQMMSDVVHSTRAAARTQATALARERQRALGAARRALQRDEARVRITARKEVIHRPTNERRHRAAVRLHRLQVAWPPLPHQRRQHGLLRVPRFVGWRQHHAGAPPRALYQPAWPRLPVHHCPAASGIRRGVRISDGISNERTASAPRCRSAGAPASATRSR